MSTTAYKLKATFKTPEGSSFSWTINNHNSEATDVQVATFMQAMVANGSPFTRVPAIAVSATKIQEISTDYDISE